MNILVFTSEASAQSFVDSIDVEARLPQLTVALGDGYYPPSPVAYSDGAHGWTATQTAIVSRSGPPQEWGVFLDDATQAICDAAGLDTSAKIPWVRSEWDPDPDDLIAFVARVVPAGSMRYVKPGKRKGQS